MMAAEAVEVTAGHDTPKHDFHLVNPSPWPVIGSMAGLALTVGMLLWMRGHAAGPWVTLLGVAIVLTTMAGWWREVLRESRHGDHKKVVSRGLRIGMGLFIVSEVFFFLAFFWAFFWGALVHPVTVPVAYPPEGIEQVSAWTIPFMNTLILLLSGATVTWAHHALRENRQDVAFKALALTVALGVAFTSFQIYEYIEAFHEGLTLQSGVYGSTFYMATGFHGFHVFVGTTFLLVCTMRAYNAAFRPEKHVGFEAASWYWHFVDVVWLFLFVCVYWWGGTLRFTAAGPG